MFRIMKRLPAAKCIAAIALLFVQIASLMVLPYVTADIVNKGVMTGDISFIWSKGILMIALSVCGLIGAIFNTFIFSKISYQLGGELREAVYSKVLHFSKPEFDKIGTSSLITRNTNDITQVQTLVEMGLKFLIMAPVMLFGGIIMTYLLSPTLSLIYLCTIPFLIISYFVIFRFANPLYTKIQKLVDSLNLFFREGLTGAKIIRAFSKETTEYDKYKAANDEYTKASISAGTIMSFFLPIITMIISLATVIIMWVGGININAGNMEVGTLIGAISYSVQILMGFGMLTNVILSVPRGQVSAKRILEVIDMPVSIEDPEHCENMDGQKVDLTFENVDFRYHGAEKKTLQNISFTVSQGQTLAIIGSTGDGKSSLVNLISRLYDVENGSVKIGSTDIREIEQKTLRDMISFSPQQSTLFFGTIRSNMLVGKPNATDDEIWEALDIANATEFITGLDMAVEKNGGNFSGGQKQRLCIARTLIKEADIYVFDDSFSALDFKTDSMVRNAMKSKLKNAVTVIVAQRIGTIMDADSIAVLDKGKLAGLGTHESLKVKNSVYKEIINSQFYHEEAAI